MADGSDASKYLSLFAANKYLAIFIPGELRLLA
jgi:hypothetical protein